MKVKLPAPLFRDPIYDGPTDPTIIWNREEQAWWIFYTQRRSTEIAIDVSTVHGTRIGVASSKDGARWLYRGTVALDFEPGHNTFWAPEVIFAEGKYHMYVSYITGVPQIWDYDRHIVHYSADNLWDWRFESILPLSSSRVIDACVHEVAPGRYKLWYKEEMDHSHTYAAESNDLYNWKVIGPEITDCAHEGPNVFAFAGHGWMITDCWKGQGLYRTEDYTRWARCPFEGNLLQSHGTRPLDNSFGHHADVLAVGNRAYILYFTHPFPPDESQTNPLIRTEARTVLQMAELTYADGWLACDRNTDVWFEADMQDQ